MAVDEVLLEHAIQQEGCSLRVYEWSEPTLSLGYFQTVESLAALPELDLLPKVRRLSGGGAILHHHEITYCCAVPATHSFARAPTELYDRIHEVFVELLNRNGIAAQLRGDQSSHPNSESVTPAAPDVLSAGRHGSPAPETETVRLTRESAEPLLCFERGDSRDILLAGHKILGSAQRRRRGAILQHGSLLMRHSPHAPSLVGIQDLVGDSMTRGPSVQEIASQLGPELGNALEITGLSDEESERASELQRQRYASIDWETNPH
jgi:lipoate-protein ligase A